jgi:hypothetical protein
MKKYRMGHPAGSRLSLTMIGGILMKRALAIFIIGITLAISVVQAQNAGIPISFVDLLSHPSRVNGKTVTVRGFLRYQVEKNKVLAVFLVMSEEDSKNLLGNEIVVAPSEEMLRSREKLNDMYVNLTGTVRVVPGANSGWTVAIRNVQSCTVWSDPNHPIGVSP